MLLQRSSRNSAAFSKQKKNLTVKTVYTLHHFRRDEKEEKTKRDTCATEVSLHCSKGDYAFLRAITLNSTYGTRSTGDMFRAVSVSQHKTETRAYTIATEVQMANPAEVVISLQD